MAHTTRLSYSSSMFCENINNLDSNNKKKHMGFLYSHGRVMLSSSSHYQPHSKVIMSSISLYQLYGRVMLSLSSLYQPLGKIMMSSSLANYSSGGHGCLITMT